MSGVVFKFMSRSSKLSLYNHTHGPLNIGSIEHIGTPVLAFQNIKPSKESAISNHLLICKKIPSSDKFTNSADKHVSTLSKSNKFVH